MGLRENEEKNNMNVAQEVLEKQLKNYIPQPIVDEEETVELDVIEQLNANILMLKDMQSRLGFMNDELQSVIGSRK